MTDLDALETPMIKLDALRHSLRDLAQVLADNNQGPELHEALFTIANHIDYIHAEWYAVYEEISKNEHLKAVS